MRSRVVVIAACLVGCLVTPGGASAAPPQGYQSDAAFAASAAAKGVVSVSATTQRVSCYAPETLYLAGLLPADGYRDGGGSPCAGAATTGEDLGPYPTQDVANPALRVKDHSESDLRIDPTNPSHLIGQSKWAVNAEGYNHLLGFYESFDGGATWPVQGHVPGYEGGPTTPIRSAPRPLGQLLLARPAVPVLLRQRRRPQIRQRLQPDQPDRASGGHRRRGSSSRDAFWHDAGGQLDHDTRRPSGLPDDGQEREHERS